MNAVLQNIMQFFTLYKDMIRLFSLYKDIWCYALRAFPGLSKRGDGSRAVALPGGHYFFRTDFGKLSGDPAAVCSAIDDFLHEVASAWRSSPKQQAVPKQQTLP